MVSLYDISATKKPTNLSINKDLLSKAKARKINLSATLERALVEELKKVESERWRKENQQAIEELNHLSEQAGLFSDAYRGF